MPTHGWLIYRCRLCGLTHPAFPAKDGHRALTDVLAGKNAFGGRVVDWHRCADGRLGVTDLQGFEPDTDSEEVRAGRIKA